jgi:hypothetical protein
METTFSQPEAFKIPIMGGRVAARGEDTVEVGVDDPFDHCAPEGSDRASGGVAGEDEEVPEMPPVRPRHETLPAAR